MGVTWTPVLLLSLCLSGLGVADPVGKEFALVFMENSLPNVSMPHLKVFLSGFFSGTEVQVRLPNGSFEKVISLSPGSMEKVELPAELEILQCSRSNMTIRISSNKDISVSAANEKPSSTGVFLVYPVTDWGTEYYIVTPDRGPANTFAQIAIVNGPLMNPIEVDLEGYVQFEGRIYSPGEQLRITLGPWESVMLQSNGSLTGTHLKAQEPVGVFSGHSCAQRSTRCNQVCLQLPPVASWGFHFVVPTLKFHGNSDTLYVTAASPTVLDIRNGSSLLTKNLLPGYIQELAVDSFVLMDISSSAPVMVLLYGYAPRSLHVFLVNVLSTEDICTAYYLFLMPGYNSTALVVVHNDSTTELQYNNEELPYIDWRSVNGTDVLWGPMFLGTNGPNIISHPDEAFAVYSFGRNGMNMYTAAGVCLEQVLQSCKDQGCEGALCPLVEQPTCYTDYQTCMAWGSTYYRTFGGRHTFQPAQDCATLLIAYPGVMGEDWPFSVERSPEEEFSLTFRTYGDTVEVTEDMSGRIKLNGELIYLPATLFDGRLTIKQWGLSTEVSYSFGLRVTIGVRGLLHLQLHNRYSTQVFGACADAGSQGPLNAYSWISSANGELCDPASPVTARDCGRMNSSVAQNCSLMADHAIFQACHKQICPKPFIDSCLHALCTETCSALEAYALACAMEGVNLTTWRTIAKCDLQCPPQSHYETCPSAPPRACLVSEGYFYSPCDGNNCIETCVCEEGLQLSMGACVPSNQCGCSWKGGYYPNGAEFLSSGCSMKCRCQGSEVECQPTQGCGVGQRCDLGSGSWSCNPYTYLSCSVLGDLNYTAFDGQQYKFQGSCLAKMAGLCSSLPGLEYFELYLEKEGKSNFTTAVILKIFRTTVTISQDNDHVEVNGDSVRLPFVLHDRRLQVFRSGLNAIVLQIDFGLVVSFDSSNGFLLVRVPDSYTNAVCGACAAPSDIVPGVQACGASCTGDCIECGAAEKESYRSFNNCGIITDLQGPFRDCRTRVNTESYFQNCLGNMCRHNGSQVALCQSLGGFVAACQEAGGTVYSWRTEELCKPSCPANAQYELCVSSCPDTCNGSLPLPCPLPCKEGCPCNPGYTQSGDMCALPEDCGCLFHGQYLKPGEATLTDGCSQECVCQNGATACKDYACDPGQMCLVHQGVRGCSAPKSPICWVSNNLHYRSFDGTTFNGNVNCSYVMAKVCKMDNLTTEFELHVTGDLDENSGMYQLKEVLLNVYGYTLSLSTETQGILVNGTAQYNPIDLENGKISAISHISSILVSTDFGLSVSLSYSLLSIQIPSNYSGKMCGLCGNANQNANDDQNINATLSKWLSRPGQGMCDSPVQDFSNDFPNETAQFSNSSQYCAVLVDPEGPFMSCLVSVSPVSFYEDCLMNFNMGGGFNKYICSTIEGYARTCQLAGSTVYPWRNESFCPAGCPANSNYTICKDPCSPTCIDPFRYTPCQSVCSEGCECNSGFYEDGGRCVPTEACGCYVQGYYYPQGYVGIDEDCQQNCSCPQFNQWQCEPLSCPSESICEVQEGVRNCYPREMLNPADHTECIFSPEAPACTNVITCGFYGSSRYETFGRTQWNQPSGVNALSVAYSCDSDLVYNVTATSESLGSVEEVIINVYGITIVIDRIQEIWVNETKIDVPTELVPGKVWLKAHSHAVLLKTDFGLTVLFKGGEYLFIMLPAGYLNSTCGLCAGVNMTMGLAATPSATVAAVTTPGAVATAAATPMTPVAAATLVTPVAAATSSAIVAVATPSEGNQSFSDTLSSWNCSDSDHPGASLCMILLDNDGPFGACHEVLDPYLYYDACLSSQCQKGGNIAGVCQSLQNYTLSCQQQNQTIEPWRNDSFCPFACPMNKHYSICVDPCGETCTAPNGTSSCNLTCIEGCECNVGLYREGDKCIPIEACGCNANGTYFKKGTEVFGDNCHRKCSCPRFDQWQCESFTCQPNQICDMWAGIERCFQKDLLAVLKALECLLFPKEPGCANYTNCAFIGKLGYLSFWKKVIFGGLSTSDSLSVAQSCVEANAGNSTNPFYDISVKFANGSEQQIESVLINVYDMDIVIEKSEHSKKFKVWANGIQVNSSSALIPGKIRLELDIVAVILGTDFGLSVVVNSPGYLYIFLPTSYLNSTCGLCAATVAQNTFSNTSVGNQTLNDIPVTWNCNNTDPTGSSLCRMLLDEDGPFGACHDVLSPSTYFNVCVDYQCDNKEDISAVCQSLQDYTDSCQAQNQTIKPWRNDSFCPYQCPPNSHYSVCADLCEPSCMAPNGSLSCDIICMEGCECDPGFYRQGDLCTPLQKCGCIDNGSYYPQGSVLVEACSQVCNCTQYQQWQCNPISCRPQQICDAQTGDPNCYPTGPTTSEENLQCVFYPNRSACAQDIHCAFSGRNGYLTFGRKFGFQHLPWPHVLPLAHSCDTDNIDNSIDSTYNVSVKVLDGSEKVMETVIINVYETDIVMEQKEQLRVWANGTPVVIPSVLIPDRVWLKQSDHFVILTTDFGLTVQNDGRYFLYIDLPQSYLNSTCGVCASTESPTDTTNGSWGGNQALNNATNTMPTNAVLGGGTQAVTSTPSSWHCNETDSMGAILCEMLLEINGPFAACHEVLSPSPYYDLCLSHLCQNGVYLPAVCQSLQSYTSACQAQNRSIEPWRNDRFCPFVCPGNSHYEICVDPCEATCSHPNRTSCDSLCMEGCECDQGFYAEYNLCLLIEDCGCYVNGSYYPQGYEIITEGCQWKCSCPQYNEWTCDPFSCRSNETCKWTNGARNCYPQGFSCPPGNEYSDCTTVCDRTCKNNSCLRPCMEGCQCPNGSYWDGNSCVTAEQCLGSGNQVQSSPQAIGVPCEISSQNSSQPLCLQCIVSSQNIITWNSTARSLEADVPYEILRVCEDSDKLWLRVVLQTLTTGQMLHVFFGQSFITVRSDLEVLVNGDTVLTPLTEFPDLQVDQSDNAVTISLPGDMVATFSWDGLLTIMVSMDFSTTLCGACAYGNMAPGNTTNNLLDCCKAEDFADL
ncbi:hypothetical protein XENTR_v10019684 [Xenopus tropicalis]|uniref:IgGFc-binding protein n=1 Tax=Xenopus tropicalis TaxID=8364 RepID=A0A8J0STH6_XENTR|nr:IgGFc-binding protein [Xenopus tropicalis]XP_031761599.1 IgGFc-binding protein [Xenopus tropicalis]KAE8594547.1 hypothetical protein XENTR_v10019684 [Xenopus tropicalis]